MRGILPRLTLILGGVRSGKSCLAETLVEDYLKTQGGQAKALYIATCKADPSDKELGARIKTHRQRRSIQWDTVEEPVNVAHAIARGQGHQAVLVECLSLWMANIMADNSDFQAYQAQVIDACQASMVPVVLVSSEVGLGTVPEHAITRCYRDHLGEMHQALAKMVECVIWVMAGLPLYIKGEKI